MGRGPLTFHEIILKKMGSRFHLLYKIIFNKTWAPDLLPVCSYPFHPRARWRNPHYLLAAILFQLLLRISTASIYLKV